MRDWKGGDEEDEKEGKLKKWIVDEKKKKVEERIKEKGSWGDMKILRDDLRERKDEKNIRIREGEGKNLKNGLERKVIECIKRKEMKEKKDFNEDK